MVVCDGGIFGRWRVCLRLLVISAAIVPCALNFRWSSRIISDSNRDGDTAANEMEIITANICGGPHNPCSADGSRKASTAPSKDRRRNGGGSLIPDGMNSSGTDGPATSLLMNVPGSDPQDTSPDPNVSSSIDRTSGRINASALVKDPVPGPDLSRIDRSNAEETTGNFGNFSSPWKYYGRDPGIQKFDASHYPVMERTGKNWTIKARLFLGDELASLPTAKHIVYDGMARSEAIDQQPPVVVPSVVDPKRIVEPWSEDELWVIDYTHMDALKFSCSRMSEMIRETHAHRLLRAKNNTDTAASSSGGAATAAETAATPLVVLGLDIDDTPNVTHCPDIPEMIAELPAYPAVSYRIAKRSIVENRAFDMNSSFTKLGELIPNVDYGYGPTVHIPFSVRSDTVESIFRIMSEDNPNSNATSTLTSPVDLKKTIDVSHYYTKARIGRNRYYHDKLRLWVNGKVKRMNRTHTSGHTISSHAGTVGAALNTGRKGVTEDFVRHMLRSKIIVVSQRDSWEDHWRLFEALASGALVMHDPMITLPRGLRANENIIIYSSLPEMRRLVRYYVHRHHDLERMAIARRGWEVAMGYHRSWHTMETTIFGRPLTRVGNPWPCGFSRQDPCKHVGNSTELIPTINPSISTLDVAGVSAALTRDLIDSLAESSSDLNGTSVVTTLKYYGPDPGIVKFDAYLNPVMKRDGNNTVKARLFLGDELTKLPTAKHIIFDGMARSDAIDLQSIVVVPAVIDADRVVEPWSDDQLWVIDYTHMESLKFSCSRMADMIKRTHAHRLGSSTSNAKKAAAPLVVLGLDIDDTPNVTHCPDIPKIIAALPDNPALVSYRIAKRSIVQMRAFDMENSFTVLGEFIPNVDYGYGPTLHIPFSVRTDTAESIFRILREEYATNNSNSSSSHTNNISPFVHERPIDVSHYYTKARIGKNRYYHDKLRLWVNGKVKRYNQTKVQGRPILTHAGTIGAALNTGRKSVTESFVRHMLRSKIIVVSQRDSWEDHWRLFEALTSGALVMHDPMISLPRGLRPDTNIVIFNSLPDLRKKVKYYLNPLHAAERLTIAHKGWKVAMGYHRSWHTMETTIFGRPFTRVGNPWPCGFSQRDPCKDGSSSTGLTGSAKDSSSGMSMFSSLISMFEGKTSSDRPVNAGSAVEASRADRVKGSTGELATNDGSLKYYGPDPGILKFDASLNPVIRRDGNNTVKARLFLGDELTKLPTAKHIIYDGMVQSDAIDLQSIVVVPSVIDANQIVQPWSDDQLWVIDYTHMEALKFSCSRMADMIKQTHAHRVRNNAKTAAPLVVLGVDIDDAPNVTHCPDIPKIIAALPAEPAVSYRIAKRSIVQMRAFDMDRSFTTVGEFIPNVDYGSGPTLHIPFSVRTDTAESIFRILSQDHTNASSAISPFGHERPIDVSHYYTKARIGRNRYYHDKLRLWVNGKVRRLNQTLIDGHPVVAHAGTIGAALNTGRKNVTEEFVRHMLQSKIIVVSQRDSWEDHWRLFEALASGAMVMHDPMISLPRGLRHHENIIIYPSLYQLRKKIKYYLNPLHAAERLAIARKGWELAMGYHRSWHTMETTIFGRPFTRVGNPWPCGDEHSLCSNEKSTSSALTVLPKVSGTGMFDSASVSTASTVVPKALTPNRVNSRSKGNDATTSARKPIPEAGAARIDHPHASTSLPASSKAPSACANLSTAYTINGHAETLKYYGPDPCILKFDASLNPVMKRDGNVVKARLFIGGELATLPTSKHIIYDGMARSDVIDLQPPVVVPTVVDPNQIVEPWSDDRLWVVDYTHMEAIKFSCSRMVDMIKQTHEHRRGRNDPKTPLVVLGMDIDDFPNVTHCSKIPKIIAALPPGGPAVSYRVAKRSIVQMRAFDQDNSFTNLGELIPNVDYGFGPTVHIPFSVRTDTAEAMFRILSQTFPETTASFLSPFGYERPIDVSHYYTKARIGKNRYYHDKLRLWVNGKVKKLNQTKLYEHTIVAHAGTIGAALNTGRKNVTESFVRHMLHSKIIVVSQRDSWEDHWRLFEAMASGALVMHDPMIALPRGLHPGENIVVYSSLGDLRKKILYYLHPLHTRERLTIAHNGWKLAMGYHRSWHTMETTIFGRPYTSVGKPWSEAPPAAVTTRVP